MTLQGIGAVIVGFVAMAIIVMMGSIVAALALRRSPDRGDPASPSGGYLAFDFLLGQLAAIAGGLVAAHLAPQAPLVHALALSGLVLAMAVVCLVSYGDKGPPRWYQAALSLTSALVVFGTAWFATSQA